MTTLRLRSPHRCRPPALAAAATLAALSGPAHAQSTLTLYGVADAGVQYLSRADGRHAAWRLQNYGILPSQLGIKGEEDLGGGWRARFQLEQGINLNDSTATVPGYAFFRGAYVGMGGPAGTVTLGRQFSTLFDKTLFYDPLWYASYSGQGVLVPLSANFVDHSIKFQSATFAGFDVEALAAMAGIAGNTRAGRVLELGGQFTSSGLSASAVLHRSHDTAQGGADRSAQRRDIGTFAARYAFASLPLTVHAGVQRLTGELDPARTIVWAARAIRQADASASRAAFTTPIRRRRRSATRRCSSRARRARCRKRTVAYLNLGYAKNSGRSAQTVYEYDPTPLAGASQFGAMLGMYHVF